MQKELFSAIDASINRAMEGIRVCEDVLRFSFRQGIFSARLKETRHRMRKEAAVFPLNGLLSSRDVAGDDQKFFDLESEKKRGSLFDVLRANFRRSIEAVRALEELSKAAGVSPQPDFQGIRFELYALEKEVLVSFEKEKNLSLFRNALYAIIDSSFVANNEYLAVASAFIDGGVSILQLRMKGASSRDLLAVGHECAALCRERGVLFIINDRPDIACLAGAHGVHLGQDDIPPSEARKILPSDMITGLSTHSLQQAVEATAQDPDYIAIGPLFDTSTKNGELVRGIGTAVISDIKSRVDLPLVAIGGITRDNAGQVMAAGADACAVISFLYSGGRFAENCRALVNSFSGRRNDDD
ncbi:MAG TPA: thiamine phosphate synthase [Spirochaetota bacterium]|nr:thiamine phosphate synthase [Spirochaetota bacterium]HPI89010.1 thiamine phosphate synthase [Spirochaetota bacterium]HPR49282.1 thiamine phosphate synthase [Spirochaetota bacterium]